MPYGRVRLARLARVRLLHHALPISLLILRKKPTVLQSILVLNIECRLSRDLIARLCWAGIHVTFDLSERQVVFQHDC